MSYKRERHSPIISLILSIYASLVFHPLYNGLPKYNHDTADTNDR